MAERISEIPPELVEYFAEAQRLRLLFEEDQTDFIASQMGLPKLEECDPTFSDRWVCKPLHDIDKNEAFRKPLGPSGRLDDDLWIKCEYVESKDKYRVTHLHNWSEPSYVDFMPVHLSPRFKVYVRDLNLMEGSWVNEA